MQHMKIAVTTKHPTLTNRPVKVATLQGWAIFLGDDKTIHMENGKDEVIEFNIEFNIDVPTAKGAIYACKFACTIEVVTASADTPVRLNINMAHSLLGRCNEDSARKTARELGWVLTCGTLKPCEHCARSKTKQKNVCSL